jgi:hypothetical protein
VQAVKLYSVLLTVKPNLRPSAWVQYGHAYKECGALAEAAVAYRRGLILSPDHPDAAHHLSHVLEAIRINEAFSADISTDSQPRKQPLLIESLALPGHALAEDDPLVQRNLILRDITLAVPVRRRMPRATTIQHKVI